MSNDRGWARARLHALREAGFGGVRVSNDRGWIRKMAEAEGECASVAAGSLFPQLEREETPAPAKPGSVSFVVYGIPVGQPRATPSAIYRRGPDGKPQLVTREGHDGRPVPMMRMVNAQNRGKHGNADIGTWRSMISYAAVEAWGRRPLIADGAVALIARFYFPRPGRLMWKTKPMPSEPMRVKPDLKNLLWAVEDSLTGIVWRDDAQICGYGDSGKWHVPGPGYGDERARVEVTIQEVR